MLCMLEVQSAYIKVCFGIAILKKLRHDEQLRLPELGAANESKMSCRITVGWLSKCRLLLIEPVAAALMQLTSDRPNPAAEACGPRHQ